VGFILFDLCDNDKKYRIEFKNGCESSNIHKVTSRESRRANTGSHLHVGCVSLGTRPVDNLFDKGSECSDQTPFNNIKVDTGKTIIDRLLHP
jgi:hypothetical protein